MQSSCIGNHLHQLLFADFSQHLILGNSGEFRSKEHGRVIPSMVLREEEELRHLGLLEPSVSFVESQLAEHDHSCIWSGFLGRLVLWL
jgi:hypothetical protein